MGTVLIVIHLMVVVAMIGMVLLQRSEGGALGMGGGGGGGGGGFMSARGAANALTRSTGILAAAFFVTSITLSILAKYESSPTDVLDQERFAKILASIYRQAQRVERHIGFARSLENNHAISEAVGLYTVGRLFPEFDRAKRWLKMGKRIICKEVLKQVFVDGSYIQHSMNYHRVMLDDCLWAVRLGDIYDEPFPQVVTERLSKAVKFLLDMQDAPSGRVPNYGSNDGALVLPLSSCDYLDYRPILQAWSHQLDEERCFDAGAWDETSLWMLGPSSLREACHKSATTSARYDTGGYYTLRGDQSWAMMRCHTYRKRPAEADMLHLDLWWKGENILRDGGSYSYNCKPPFNTYFKSTAAHNTLVVEESNQMTKGPRFMWFDWTTSKLNGYSPPTAGAPGHIEGEHSAYQKRFGVTHRRRVDYLSHDDWRICDRLVGAQSTNASSMWHFPDVPHEWDSQARQLDFEVRAGRVRMHFEVTNGEIDSSEVLRADEDENSAAGWESLYYGAKQARPVLRINLCFGPDTALVTRIEFKPRS